MKIVVLGGDGFCGWPASLNLANNGHDVLILDNLSRRDIEVELGAASLTPIASIEDRLKAAKRHGWPLSFIKMDIRQDYDELLAVFLEFRPDAVVHFAEQRSAPYSMKSSGHRRYTVENNIIATHNVLSALVDSKIDAHLVHLGTMGVYGYNTIGSKIPEGYLDVLVKDDAGDLTKRSILYPADPGSIYHMTKTQDQLLFYFYNKNYGLRITDLHQGIIWGTNTDLTSLDVDLINRFDYDGDFGTVLNRFLVQAALNYPLSVHGTGGQQRAFIHIRDSVECIDIAVRNPSQDRGRVRIFNQATEVYKVSRLAELVSQIAGVEVGYIENPRVESENNELKMVAEGLIALGLNPTRLADGLLHEIMGTATKYIHRVQPEKIPCTSKWRS